MKTKEILDALVGLLEPGKFKDYAPNGLQVQGDPETKRIVCGVTASEELIDIAVSRKAQTIIVHHGYFWKGENPCILGIKRNRLKKLLENNINLVAFHLPLDMNPTIGNNVLFGRALGVKNPAPLEAEPFVWTGDLEEALTTEELGNKLFQILSREPFVVPVDCPPLKIQRVAWCTGAAQDYLETAFNAGAQAYISGEISERTVLEARELNVPYFAAGHHATETFGIESLASWLHESYPELDVEFFDIENPV